MAFTIITRNTQNTFESEDLINISSKAGGNCCINFGFDYVLTVQYDKNTGKCCILNPLNCNNFLFKGVPLAQKLEFDNMCKLMVKDSDEFITIKYSAGQTSNVIEKPFQTRLEQPQSSSNNNNSTAKMRIEEKKSCIEQARVSIIKQVGFQINDLKNKISMNSKAGIFLHIGLFAASIVLAFGVANYLTGLPLKDAATVIQMPVNMRLVVIYSVIIYAIGLTLKQGIFLFLQNKVNTEYSSNAAAEKFMIVSPLIFFAGVYVINLLYYMTPKSMPFFAIFMSLFFTAGCIALAVSCGYFKHNSTILSKELDKYEYREDFEKVMREYQQWIEHFINNLSAPKIRNIKDRLFNLQLKSAGETILGILTAPFLAYGVSNTLAMCFPEAAGWIRISGLRFSPVFLVLASFLIIFAFFAFVNAFFCNKKIQASNVLKNDGYSNYLQHGVDIYGLQGVKKLDTEMRRSFIIGICIIFIEFSMNISYFMQEMGGDISGMFLSSVAALVPTALLLAETYMLSQTKFEIYTCDELIAKLDR